MHLRCRIEMSVFAGVVLVLLFIFMVIPQPDHSWALGLAQTGHAIPMPDANREDAMIVSVQRDGKIFFDTVQVGPEDLAIRIEERLRQGAPGLVYVKADARARYRSVAEVVDGVRAAGMQRIGLLTELRSGWSGTE